MSRGREIHKRFGLKFAIAYRIKKKLPRILFESLKNPKKFKIFLLLKKQRLSSILSNKSSLEFITLYYQDILEWLKSKEYKETYLDTHHPYPPLLNPQRLVKESDNPYRNLMEDSTHSYLSYENIPPKLAWDLNLPLPPYYNLIWLRLDGSGSSAYTLFMELCNINRVNNDWDIRISENLHYMLCYTNLLANKNSYNIISIHEYFSEKYTKFYSLIDKKVPAICNVRDQIERLKHGVNHLSNWVCAPLTKRFNLTCEYTKLFPILSYDGCTPTIPPKSYTSNVPLVDSLYHYSNEGWRNTSFKFYKRLKYLKNICHIEYIDMSEISKDKAFETWTRLANQFGFTPPQIKDKRYFENRINNNTGEFMHFPVTLYAHPSDIDKTAEDLTSLNLEDGFEIILTLQQRVLAQEIPSPFYFSSYLNQDISVDITPLIFEIPLKHDNIKVFIEKEKYSQFKENQKLFLFTQRFLVGYIQAYEKELETIKKSHITPKQIIEYLCKKEHTVLRHTIRNSLKKSLLDVQNKRPDIVQSWKYYQEFEKMCEEDV